MTYEEYSSMRDELGLSDYAVSNGASVSRASLSQWKNGNTKPSKNTIERLQTYFQLCKDLPSVDLKELSLKEKTKNNSVSVGDLIDAVPKIESYFVTMSDGTQIELETKEYNELNLAIKAYADTWLKLHGKI